MYQLINFKARPYQESIYKSCIDKNTLVVLPTGVGKTAISLLLGIDRLNNHPNSKILICSPTKPLCAQHVKTFKDHTNIEKEKILLFTGAISPEKRKKIWESALVIIATPQTIQSDILNHRLNLKDFSMLCLDEAHRSRMRYANTLVAKSYIKSSIAPRILALTASPGSTKEKINEICDNLYIENVEIRTESDNDLKPYVQEKSIDFVHVKLPQEFIEIKNLIRKQYKEKLKSIKKFGVTKPLSLINKRDLLELQIRLRKQISKGKKSAFTAISITAQLIKLKHMQELIETQGVNSLLEFIKKLKLEKTKAANSILKNESSIKIEILLKKLIKADKKHPKMDALLNIIESCVKKNKNSKIIIFANYRNTVKEIVKNLNKIRNIKAIELMGQKEGITQKQQIQTIKDFENNIYNVIVGTSISEEGLSISTLDLAIFYDHVASAIRRIQRGGRVARVRPGKIIYIITQNTVDSAYYWKSKRDETTMKKIIYGMKITNKPKTLSDFS